MPQQWHTLEDNVTALTQARLHPSGGLELRTLACADYAGYHVTLTIDQTAALLEYMTDHGLPAKVDRLSEKVVRLWCEVNGYGLVPPNKEPIQPIQPIHDIMREVREERAMAHPHDLEPGPTLEPKPWTTEATFAPTKEHTFEELTEKAQATVRDHSRHTNGTSPAVLPYATPSRDATIIQAAISFWEDTHQRSILTDAKALESIRHTLSASLWAPHIHYWSHAKKLHEELPALFPVLLPMEW